MTALPNFPTESLAGNFPNFPVGYISVPDLIDLPSYIYSVTLYYGNPLNYPYLNPPIIASWSIPYPKILQIPLFLEKVIAWLLGWLGAVFEWTFQYTSIGGANLTIWFINTTSGDFNALVLTSNRAAAATGIFAPLILAALITLIALSAIAIGFLVINAIKVVIP